MTAVLSRAVFDYDTCIYVLQKYWYKLNNDHEEPEPQLILIINYYLIILLAAARASTIIFMYWITGQSVQLNSESLPEIVFMLLNTSDIGTLLVTYIGARALWNEQA